MRVVIVKQYGTERLSEARDKIIYSNNYLLCR